MKTTIVKHNIDYSKPKIIEWKTYQRKAITPIYEEDIQAKHGYVKCPSCDQYFPWSHPEHWYTMCEDCIW